MLLTLFLLISGIPAPKPRELLWLLFSNFAIIIDRPSANLGFLISLTTSKLLFSTNHIAVENLRKVF